MIIDLINSKRYSNSDNIREYYKNIRCRAANCSCFIVLYP